MFISPVEIEKIWADKVKKTNGNVNLEYWNRRAEDYNDYILSSNFEYGEKLVELFKGENLLKPYYKLLDIGAGPGSISIPLAKYVESIVAVEPAIEMYKRLANNLRRKKLIMLKFLIKDISISYLIIILMIQIHVLDGH